MITENGQEIKAPRTWGDQETNRSGIDSDRSRGTGQTGGEAISKSLSTYRNDRQGRNFAQQRGQAIIGGILDRLILKTQDLIQESENRTVELKNHLQELKDLSQQFKTSEEPE
ncbi:hypothetical protein [Nostoc sp. NMS4]|uniref:hypothetical protein n=1 Tax=Nostoc sp. NMS4 TaxID=2815390 RepID=UPI0025F3B093|nr:hypothetical protein [Nostoc sp. NMS4]MBN3926104.1 hypothetical protein [Nostoc sp. NMS4]